MLSIAELFETEKTYLCFCGEGEGESGGESEDGGAAFDAWADATVNTADATVNTADTTSTDTADATVNTADTTSTDTADGAWEWNSQGGYNYPGDAQSPTGTTASAGQFQNYNDVSTEAGKATWGAQNDYFNKSVEPAFGRMLGLNRTQEEIDKDVTVTAGMLGGYQGKDLNRYVNAMTDAAYRNYTQNAIGPYAQDPNFAKNNRSIQPWVGAKEYLGKELTNVIAPFKSDLPMSTKLGYGANLIGKAVMPSYFTVAGALVDGANRAMGIAPGAATFNSMGVPPNAEFTDHGNNVWSAEYPDSLSGTWSRGYVTDPDFNPDAYSVGGPGTISYATANQDNLIAMGGLTGGLAALTLGSPPYSTSNTLTAGGASDSGDSGGMGSSIANSNNNTFSSNISGDSQGGVPESNAPATPNQPLPAGVTYAFPVKEREFGTTSYTIPATIDDSKRFGRRRGLLAGLY